MSKRIFTKLFTGQVGAVTAETVVFNAKDTWLAQEDIEVIGASISVVSTTPSENDGYATVMVELSQVGIGKQDGAILSGVANEGWNTSPAGITQTTCNETITFPQGFAVPIKEEGYLYVNTSAIGKTAGISTFDYQVYVYYTKKGAR